MLEKILSTVSDDTDKSMQIRILLEKLLNYAINDCYVNITPLPQ